MNNLYKWIVKKNYINNDSYENKNVIKRMNKIMPIDVGNVIPIYNGKLFINLMVLPSMVNLRAGDSIHTRKRCVYRSKKKKKKK